MSKQIHFRGKRLRELKDTIEGLTGFMAYESIHQEVTTFTKAGDGSFYDRGNQLLIGITGEHVPYKVETAGSYENGLLKVAKITQPSDIEEFLAKHERKIEKRIEELEASHEKSLSQDYDLFSLQRLLDVFRFVMANDLEIWCH